LLLLLIPLFFVVIGLGAFQTRIDWIIDVYVRAWTRIWRLHFFVYWSRIAAVEGCMDGLLLDDFVFDIVLLFLVLILTWSWILGEGLSGVRCFTFMLPEFSSFGLGQETLGLLSNEHAVRIVSKMIVSFFLHGNNRFICSWSWSKSAFFLILAIWNVTLENFVLPRGVELLLTHLIEIVDSRSWILRPTLVIMGIVGLLKQLPIDF